jgi:hypothetical protein
VTRFFTAIGHGLKFVLGGFFSWLYHHLFVSIGHGFRFVFGSWWPWAAGLVALIIGVAIGIVIYRHRTRVDLKEASSARSRIREESPHDIENQARFACDRGEFELAVRLWFTAGVLRLTQMGLIANGASRTDREILRTIASASFVDVARRHEQIVYGRQSATAADARSAAEKWSDVFRELSLRGAS